MRAGKTQILQAYHKIEVFGLILSVFELISRILLDRNMYYGLTNREDSKITRHLQKLTRSPQQSKLSLPPGPAGRSLEAIRHSFVALPGQRGEKLALLRGTCELLRVTCDF